MALVDNCIGYWKFDESVVTNVDDAVAANDGTTHNCVDADFKAGLINNGLDLGGNGQGTGECVEFDSTYAEIDSQTNFTMSVWFKADNTEANNAIMEHGKEATERFIIGTGNSANHLVVRYYSGGGAEDRHFNVAFTDTSSWHNIIVVHHADKSFEAYLDNVLMTATAVNLNLSANYNWWAGCQSGGNFYFWDGMLDEFALWDRAITEAERAELYNGGAGNQYPFPEVGTNLQINVGDAWKEVPKILVNVGDAWKEVAGIQVNVGDAWKEVF